MPIATPFQSLRCLLAGLLLLAAAGCPSNGDDACVVGTANCPCTKADACDPGLRCVASTCVEDRGGGAGGVGGGLGAGGGFGGPNGGAGGAGGGPVNRVDGGTPASGAPVGAGCADPGDCREGLCLNPQALPGGYCSKRCGGQLLSVGDPCPAGSACTQLNEATSMCMAVCNPATAGSCRSGYACARSEGGVAVCLPRCQSDKSCRPGYGCNTATGVCQLGMRELGASGAACAAPAECRSNTCLTETASEGKFPGGYCLRQCSADIEDMPCPNDDGICVGVPDADGTKAFACFGSCTTGVDCRAQYFCSADIDARASNGKGICVPRCDKLGCREGFSCDTSVGNCVMGGLTGGPAQIERRELGVMMLGETRPDFKTLTVDVPAGTVSFAVLADPMTPGSTGVLTKATAPNGEVLYDYFDPTKTAFIGPIASYPGQPFSLVYPNAPRVNVIPGKYEIVLGADAPGSYKVTVLLKKQMGVVQGGPLPVVFWFAKQKYLTAQTAQTDMRFQQAMAMVVDIYKAIGVQLGPITYTDLGPESEALAVLQTRDQMAQLFALGTSSNVSGLNFYFIDQFNETGGSAGAIGRSGGIPGPVALPGLGRGGVVVALSVLQRPEIFATAVAHEAGHYLGLFHVSERDGTSFDPLLDTPECPASNDANMNMKVDPTECVGKGSDNLMFWQASGMPMRTITNDQRFVILRNPILQ
jgi:hypothetical protein